MKKNPSKNTRKLVLHTATCARAATDSTSSLGYLRPCLGDSNPFNPHSV
ncbi:hypothetical protein LEMLEM_LOCUS26234 [Lemmus lemmus]